MDPWKDAFVLMWEGAIFSSHLMHRAVTCHAPSGNLIRIHGCQELSLTNLALFAPLASLTGYRLGPILSPLSQVMHPEPPCLRNEPDPYEKWRTVGGCLVYLMMKATRA